MPKAYMYILKCADNSYYTGSTRNIEKRLQQHETGKGAKYTSTRLPIELLCLEEYERIDEAYAREKQVQGWNRKKKEALINNEYDKLPALSKNRSYLEIPDN
jgi:putative endonuclease